MCPRRGIDRQSCPGNHGARAPPALSVSWAHHPPFGFHTHGSAITRWTSAGILALIAERRGESESAALLAGAATAISEAASVGHSPFDEAILEESREKVRASLGDTRFEGLFQERRSMPWDDLHLVGAL